MRLRASIGFMGYTSLQGSCIVSVSAVLRDAEAIRQGVRLPF